MTTEAASSSSSSEQQKSLRRRLSLSFSSSPLTYGVLVFRICLILLPILFPNNNYYILSRWIYDNRSFQSVLVRPHQTLDHLREVRAIQQLKQKSTSPTTSWLGSSAYLRTNYSVRIPPLLLATLLRLLDTKHPELWLSIFLLLVDITIAYLLEQIGNNVLIHAYYTPRIQQERNCQQQLPDIIQPDYAHIFPIVYHHDEDHEEEEEEEGESTVQNSKSKSWILMSQLPYLSAQLYFCSPWTMIPSSTLGGCCWQNLPTLFLLASIYEASRGTGYYSISSFLLAGATYMEPFSVVYVIPVLLLFGFIDQNQRQESPTFHIMATDGHDNNDFHLSFSFPHKRVSYILFPLFFIVWSLALQIMTGYYLLKPKSVYWDALLSTYGEAWLTTSPNLSLQWYLRMQLFARFQTYFGAVLAVIPFLLVGPMTIRLWKYPEVLITSFCLIWTIYRPVQVLQDANVALCLMLFCPQSLARIGLSAIIISLCSMLVPVALIVVDHWMWLEGNHGNANYIFFQCLAYNVFWGVVLGQFVSASVQRDKALRINLIEYKNENGKKESESLSKQGSLNG